MKVSPSSKGIDSSVTFSRQMPSSEDPVSNILDFMSVKSDSL